MLLPFVRPQFFTNTGLIAAGYKLFFYVNGTFGSTNSQQATTDGVGGATNPNPILLDSAGRPDNSGTPIDIYLTPGLSYTVVMASDTDTDPPASPIWQVDNVTSQEDLTFWRASYTATRVDSDTFQIAGTDVSSLFPVGSPIKLTGGADRYATVSSVTFSTNTTVDVIHIKDSNGDTATLHASMDTAHYASELAKELAGETPTNLTVERANILRFGAAVDGVTVDSSAIYDALAAEGEAIIPAGTCIVDTLTLSTAGDYKITLKKNAVLKHKDAASNHMLIVNNASVSLEIEGGSLDGNKSNQTGRYAAVHFSGLDFSMHRSVVKNTVAAGIEADLFNTFNVDHTLFKDIGEHGGTLGQTAYGIHIDTSTIVGRVNIDHNFFLNSAPANVDHAPTAVILSMPNGFARNSSISHNKIEHFGTKFSGNQTGAIEIYSACDNLVNDGNTISHYYFSGMRINDSGRIVLGNTTIVDAAADIGSGEYALSILSKNHESTAKYDVVINNLIIDNEYQGGAYISGGGAGFELHRVLITGLNIKRAGSNGLYHAYCDGEIIHSGILMDDITTYGYRFENCSGTVKLSDGLIKNCDSGIFARTNVTSLDLELSNMTVDTATNYGYSIRNINDLKVVDCKYKGAAPASNEFDMQGITSGYVKNCSWQEETEAKTASYSIASSDYGKRFSNEGAGASVEFTLPDVTTIPEGFYVDLYVLAAQQVDFDPNNADRIFPTTDKDGDRIRNAGNIGESARLTYLHADGWVAQLHGTWSDPDP